MSKQLTGHRRILKNHSLLLGYIAAIVTIILVLVLTGA